MPDETKPPLLRRRKNRAKIGYEIVGYQCLDCGDEGSLAPSMTTILVEGDDAGIPYTCYKCGKELKPRQ